jgi:hypothetical protein
MAARLVQPTKVLRLTVELHLLYLQRSEQPSLAAAERLVCSMLPSQFIKSLETVALTHSVATDQAQTLAAILLMDHPIRVQAVVVVHKLAILLDFILEAGAGRAAILTQQS